MASSAAHPVLNAVPIVPYAVHPASLQDNYGRSALHVATMTDPRQAEAQERAASVAAAWGDFDRTKKQYLEGWGQAVETLRRQRDKAKWAWQFISAVALDGHNREHDERAVALAECPESPCPGWREDLQGYQDVITCSDNTIAAFIKAMVGERDG